MHQPPPTRRASVRQARSQSQKGEEEQPRSQQQKGTDLWGPIGALISLLGVLISAVPFFLPTPALVRASFVVLGLITVGVVVFLYLFYRTKRRVLATCILVGVVVLSGGFVYMGFAQSSSGQSNTSSLGETLYTYRGHHGSIERLVWSPDGKRITSYSTDGTVQTWDATTGNNPTVRAYYNPILGATITEVPSPDGKLVASLVMLPVPSDELVRFPKGTIRVFDVATGKDILPQDRNIFGWVNQLTWSPQANSNSELIASSEGSVISIWDARTGKDVRTYDGNDINCCPVENFVYGLAWSPDGQFIASSGWIGDVQIWEVATGKLYATYQSHCPGMNEVDYISWQRGYSDSSRIVIACDTNEAKDVLIEILSVNISYDYNYSTPVVTPTFSITKASSIILCHRDKLPPEGDMYSFSWDISTDDGYIVYSCIGSSMISIWDIANKKNVLTYKSQNDIVTALAWSRDGRYIASGNKNGTVQVWRAV